MGNTLRSKLLTSALLSSIGLTVSPAVVWAGITVTSFGFEANEGWFFTGNAGLDYNKNYQHEGKGNGWVRSTKDWNAINNWVSISAPLNSECSASAWLRSSPTLTNGYMSVRKRNSDGSIGSVVKEIKLTGAGNANPANKNYNLYTFQFKAPSNYPKLLFYVGLLGNGKDSWIQIDDVTIACTKPF